jgi:hypothetical protein
MVRSTAGAGVLEGQVVAGHVERERAGRGERVAQDHAAHHQEQRQRATPRGELRQRGADGGAAASGGGAQRGVHEEQERQRGGHLLGQQGGQEGQGRQPAQAGILGSLQPPGQQRQRGHQHVRAADEVHDRLGVQRMHGEERGGPEGAGAIAPALPQDGKQQQCGCRIQQQVAGVHAPRARRAVGAGAPDRRSTGRHRERAGRPAPSGPSSSAKRCGPRGAPDGRVQLMIDRRAMKPPDRPAGTARRPAATRAAAA